MKWPWSKETAYTYLVHVGLPGYWESHWSNSLDSARRDAAECRERYPKALVTIYQKVEG